MRRTVIRFAAAVGALACLASGGRSVAAEATSIDLARDGAGAPPAGFAFARTGEGELGQWTVVRDATAASGFAIEHVSTDRHEERYPLAIYQPLSCENGEIAIRFKIVSGTMLTAGIAFGVRNPDSYYVVSANALEQRVDLLLVMNGSIERIETGAEVNIESGRWHALKVIFNDEHVAVALDQKVLFTTYDRTRRKDGRIALWTREDNVTRFDQIEVRPLPNTPWQ
jgi:hypothetical protein